MIRKNNLKKLIEPHFYSVLCQDGYEVETIMPKKLLVYTRFDLAFKILYIDLINKNIKLSKMIYKEHIRAFSLGKFIEPGNDNKNNIDKFISDFDKTFKSIKKEGFDSSKSLIPLSRNGAIANGAHRVASAICLDKNVECVNINTDNQIYDYLYFYRRNVPNCILDIVATKFIEYSDNTYMAFLWPISGKNKEVGDIIPNVVYKKEIRLNLNGAHNLLSQIYYGEKWIGNPKDNFKGVQTKLVECFKTFNPFEIIAFQCDNLEDVLKIKEEIRDFFGVGKHSVHITDTKEEAIIAARMVFNDNSVHFLNHAKPNKYISTYQKIEKAKEFIAKNNFNSDDIILDGSIVLSVYGLREANDIDYLVDDSVVLHYHDEELECHEEELKYHDLDKADIIYNPMNYFYFNGLKFISFDQIYKMKKNRSEGKDKRDCQIMEALLEGDYIKGTIGKINQNMIYLKIKIISNIIVFLKKIGLYEFVKGIIRGRLNI